MVYLRMSLVNAGNFNLFCLYCWCYTNNLLILKIWFTGFNYSFMFCIYRDVCQNGFSDDVTGKADAVFLDLPHPHLVVPFAIKALKPSGNYRINIMKVLAITFII